MLRAVEHASNKPVLSAARFSRAATHRRLKTVLALSTLLIVQGGCGGGAQSNFTVNNPAPALTAVSPSVLAVGSPDSSIMLIGTNFISASQVTLGGSALNAQFLSSTQLSATIPAGNLASPATLQVAVTNPSPGGGASSPQRLTVVQVASLVLVGTPSKVGQPAGPWQLAVSAADPKGSPIPKLSINLQASVGTLSATQGFTDATGGLAVTITPPPNAASSTSAGITATTGAQTAIIDILFSGVSSAAARLQNLTLASDSASISSSVPQATTSPLSIGIANGPGTANALTNTSILQSGCESQAALSVTETTTCQALLSQNNIQLSAPSIINASCQVVSVAATVVSLVDCGVTVGTIVSCILAETGIGGAICAATAEFTLTDAGPSCIEFLAQEIADQFGMNSVTGIAFEGVGLIQDPTDPLNLASLFCSAVQPLFPTGPLIYVANSSNDTITVMDQQGTIVPMPGGFPHLNVPDGLTYDPDNGLLYAANSGNNTITAYDPKTGNQVFTSGNFSNSCTGYDIVYEGFSRRLYVNDAFCNKIVVYSADGNSVSLASGAFSNVVGPYGLTWNPLNDQILITDGVNNQVFVCTSSGGSCAPAAGFSMLNIPDDLITGPDGNIYIPNEGNGTVDQYAPGGALIRIISLSLFSSAHAVAFYGTDSFNYDIYVTDTSGAVVWIFDNNGNFVAKLGGPGVLSSPTGVVVIP